jgi:hypothetical protein
MTRRPHDPTDLYLAPVALAVDARLDELAGLTRAELAERVALETNREAHSAEAARHALVDEVTYLIELHGWEVSWDPRGIRLSHDEYSLVLGAPAVFAEFVADPTPS